MTSFPFAVVAPERTAFDGEAEEVLLRTAGGDIGILAHHVPYIGAVAICPCEIRTGEGQTERLAVHGGFLEVDPDGVVTLLADVVEKADEIDTGRAERARDEASSRASSDPDNLEAAAALLRAEVRLDVAGSSS